MRECYDGNCLVRVSRPLAIGITATWFHCARILVMSGVAYPSGGGAAGEVGGVLAGSFRKRTPVEPSLVSLQKGRASGPIKPGKPRRRTPRNST